MSQFSTGELAKAAGVSVRTVQYYDQRGILVPSEVTDGGRRIYRESDLERLQVICFLRDMDFSIAQIAKLLREDNMEQVLVLLVMDQIEHLEASLTENKRKLERAKELQKMLKTEQGFSLEKLTDISRLMDNKASWVSLQLKLWGSAIGLGLVYLLAMLLAGYVFHSKWLMLISMVVFLIAINLTVFYFSRQFSYFCPNCHKTFAPNFKEFGFAGHTPRTRKLTCPHCHVKSYCLELAKEKEGQ